MTSNQPELPYEVIDAHDAEGNELQLIIDAESDPQHDIHWENFGYDIVLTTDSEEHTRALFELLKHTRIVGMD